MVSDHPRELEAIFGGCPGHSKALAIFVAASYSVAAAFAAKAIIQSPITSEEGIIQYDRQAQIVA